MDLNMIYSTLGIDPLERGLQILDAANLARQHFPRLDPDQPALIVHLDSRALARACKRTLLVLYPHDHMVTYIDAATPERKIETLPLANLERAEFFDAKTTLVIPPLPRAGSLNALAEIVAHLRAPEGCPWDREQTHKSLRKYLLEETYEALEAIDKGDIALLREELGDLLAHLLLQIQIAHQADEFSLSAVVAGIAEKLVRRHPHVFGDVKVSGMPELLANWERIKQSEKREAGSDKSEIPLAMPALMRAQRVASRRKTRVSAKKIAGEIERLPRAKDQERRLGEALFMLAAFAAAKDIDAESALRAVAEKRRHSLKRTARR